MRFVDPDGMQVGDPPFAYKPFSQTVDNTRHVRPVVPTQQNKPSMAETAFPKNNSNVTFGYSVSVGYKGLDQNIAKKDIVGGKSNDNSKNVELVSHTDNTQSALFLGGGTETTSKNVWVTGNIINPKTGGIISKDATFPINVTEKTERVEVGIGIVNFSAETREVYVHGRKETYQHQEGIEVSRGFNIGGKNGNAGLKLQGTAGLKTNWKDVE